MQNGNDTWNSLNIPYVLAANIRNLIAKEISVDYTGLYIAGIEGLSADLEKDFTVAPAEFWKLAAESKKQVQEYLKNKEYLAAIFQMQPNGEDEPEPDMSFNPDKNPHEYRVEQIVFTTSYGAWEFPANPYDIIKPVAVFSNSSIHVTGPVFSQQLITVNGRLTWTIGWSQRVVSEQQANQFAEIMFKLLKEAVIISSSSDYFKV